MSMASAVAAELGKDKKPFESVQLGHVRISAAWARPSLKGFRNGDAGASLMEIGGTN
jgi:hypothetical protein